MPASIIAAFLSGVTYTSLRVEVGACSRVEPCGGAFRRGADWRKVLQQKAAEQAFAKSLGLDLQAVTQAAATAGIGLLAALDRENQGTN